MRASKSGSIPIRKYIEQRDALDGSIKQLQEIFDSESQIMAANVVLEGEKIELQRKINDLERALTDANYQYSLMDETASQSLLQGEWKVEITFSNDEKETHLWNISGDIVREGIKSWLLQNLTINPFDKDIAFNLRSEDGEMNYSAIFLKSNEDHTRLRSKPGDIRYKSFTMDKLKLKTKRL